MEAEKRTEKDIIPSEGYTLIQKIDREASLVSLNEGYDAHVISVNENDASNIAWKEGSRLILSSATLIQTDFSNVYIVSNKSIVGVY